MQVESENGWIFVYSGAASSEPHASFTKVEAIRSDSITSFAINTDTCEFTVGVQGRSTPLVIPYKTGTAEARANAFGRTLDIFLKVLGAHRLHRDYILHLDRRNAFTTDLQN